MKGINLEEKTTKAFPLHLPHCYIHLQTLLVPLALEEGVSWGREGFPLQMDICSVSASLHCLIFARSHKDWNISRKTVPVPTSALKNPLRSCHGACTVTGDIRGGMAEARNLATAFTAQALAAFIGCFLWMQQGSSYC